MKQTMDTLAIKSSWLVAILLWLLLAAVAHAHGTKVEAVPEDNVIILNATYDTGEPMIDAQVLVYAPSSPQTAWQKGVADAAGRYQFEVDPAEVGDWSVNIRTAGHGQWVYFEVDERGNIALDALPERSAVVKWATAGVVVAALVGVAGWSLFGRTGEKNAHT